MPITAVEIRGYKPRRKDYSVSDGGGLYLFVKSTGGRFWHFRYRINGRRRRISLGPYPEISLKDARDQAMKLRAQVIDGIDPGDLRKERREHQKNTFASVAEEWFRYSSVRWAESTRYKARLYLDNDILPQIGKRPIQDITRPELVQLVRKVEQRGTFNAASKIRQWLNQIFRYALAKGAVEMNPATELSVVAARQSRVRHHPFIPFAELSGLLDTLDKAERVHVLTRHAIYLLLLTGARPGELRNAPWAEFDLDSATWTIPPDRMKMRKPHIIPLPAQAVERLHLIAEITGEYELVFAGRNSPSRPMSENTINKALSIIGYKGRQSGHGFRHLISTELNNRGYRHDWIERQLAHGDPDRIRETYNHAIYLDQRREMMQDWADLIDWARTSGKVVHLHPTGAP